MSVLFSVIFLSQICLFIPFFLFRNSYHNLWFYLCYSCIMNADLWLIVVWVIIWILVWYLIAKLYFLVKIKKQRSDAVTRSRNVVLGHVHEKIAPLLPNFPYSYKDLVFLWKGVDYLVLDGLSKWNLNKIVFLEIKSGVSQLNRNEQMVKHCIEAKRVSYEIWKN